MFLAADPHKFTKILFYYFVRLQIIGAFPAIRSDRQIRADPRSKGIAGRTPCQ
jgi:hypothetical protein